MKTRPVPARRFRRAGDCLILLALPLAAAVSAENSPPAPKEYNMFVGADLFLVKDQQAYPILYAEGKTLDVKIGAELKHYNIREVNSLRATPNLKLTRSLATITGYKQEQGFTAANDPHLKWGHDNAVSAELAFAAINASAPKFDPSKDLQAGVATTLAAHGVSAPAAPANAVTPSAPNMPSSPAELARASTDNLTSTNYDVMRVDFEISSPRRIANPYMAIITDIADPARPGAALRWFYIDTLKDIDSHPQQVHVSEAGFPPGFKVLNSSVHIYSRGQEIATNQAERRLEMSLDEAHEYLTIQHLAAHAKDTLPPSLALAELPADFRQRVTPNQLNEVLALAIDADGRVSGFAAAAGAGEPLDPYVVGAVRNFRFNPALEKGRPVTGRLETKLSDLVH